ncbi:MAG: hypothetical protein IKR61_05180 [Lachnospiraceae bacterium]|nr:hypothetical protein [Lachnospiraceae bacterium]
MGSNQLYPFERNRYYPGKMLTSADFQTEQDYFINHQRFMNGLMYGSGIVCGLGVLGLDDLSIMVESGAAIDGTGREIVVDSSVVKKLSAIEGFDSLKTDLASLCLRFRDKEVHSVYAVNRGESDKDYEYNHVSEGYELFLLDRDDIAEEEEPETEFLTKQKICSTVNYLAEIAIPSTVSRKNNVKVELLVTKLSNANASFSMEAILETPAFTAPGGERQIRIDLPDVRVKKGETLHKAFWVKVQDLPAADTNVILKSGSAHAYENGASVPAENSFSLKIALSDQTPLELVSTEIGRVTLEQLDPGMRRDYIHLADIRLMRTDNAYVIEEVTERGIKKYITAPGRELMRTNFMGFYRKEVELDRENQGPAVLPDAVRESAEAASSTEYATGTLEIPLGKNARQGEVFFSGEITHGLGKGNVYVQVGYDHLGMDKALGAKSRSTIYGNPDLFQSQIPDTINVETAVRVLGDKGSFVVAAKLLGNVEYLVLTFRWVAFRLPAGNDLEIEEDYQDKSISAETPTVVMGAKESHFFGVRFHNMKACSIAYELTAPSSGEITADGIYTAPSKEGVYEIRIYCTDMPVICTYAYAIVKKTDGAPEEA